MKQQYMKLMSECIWNSPVGIGEHPQIIESIETEIAKLAEALEKIDTINANFYAKADRSEL